MPYFIKGLGYVKKNACPELFFAKRGIYYVNNPMDMFNGAMFFSETELMVSYESFTFYNRSDILKKNQLHYFERGRE